MYCENCGKKIENECQKCPYCGADMKTNSDINIEENIYTGTNEKTVFKMGKKIVLKCLWLLCILMLIIGPFTSSNLGTKTDAIIEIVQYYIAVIGVVIIPLLLLSNTKNIRDKLPLYKKRKVKSTVLAIFLTWIILSLLLTLGISISESFHTTQYREAYAKQMKEEEAMEAKQKKIEKKEEEEKAAKKKEEEKKAAKKKEEEEKTAKKKEEEEKAKKKKKEEKKAAKKKEEEKKAAKKKEEEKKTAKKKEEKEKAAKRKEEEKKESIKLTYDFSTDVKNGALYGKEGKIVDSQGNIIEEYRDYKVTDKGYIATDAWVVEGYFVGTGGKITFSAPESMESNEDKEMLSANPERCATGTISINDDGSYTMMDDDGNYFDEVVLGAWFNEDGSPKADGFPKRLDRALNPRYGYDTNGLKDFKFIDGHQWTLQAEKRSVSTLGGTNERIVAMLVTNIIKEDAGGEIIYYAKDYFTSEYIVFHGNFDGVLNGDSALMFGVFSGLAADDTANFEARYIEIENGLF